MFLKQCSHTIHVRACRFKPQAVLWLGVLLHTDTERKREATTEVLLSLAGALTCTVPSLEWESHSKISASEVTSWFC